MSKVNINSEKPSVLLVDDQPIVRLLLREYLGALNLNVEEAESGEECLKKLKENAFALICLDVMMSGMDGYEVLEKIRSDPSTENTPVIMISAIFQTDEHIIKGISGGAIDFLSKPINPQIFINKVNNFVQLYEKQKKLDLLIKKLENTNKRLLENEQKFRRITYSASDAIIVLNPTYEIKFFNQAALDIFGYNKYELMQENIFERMIAERSINILAEKIHSLSSSRLSSKNSLRLTGKHKLDYEFPIELSLALFETAEKDLNYTLIIRDISHQVKVEKEALSAKELRVANKVMKEFLDKVSHELRTPMTAIIGISDMLLKYNSQNLQDDQVEGLKLINQSGNRLLDLINDILDISKLEAKKHEVHIGRFNFDEFLAEIRSIVITLIGDKPIRFTIRKSPGVPEYISTDLKILSQILNNLLSNAVKYTNEGNIRLLVHQKSDSLFFEISDTGIGISQENLKIIFRKFEQIDNSASKQHKGTGLGLYITKKLIELMTGEIHVVSQVDVGTVMMFNIPVKFEAAESGGESILQDTGIYESNLLNDPNTKLAVIIDFRTEIHVLLKPVLEEENFLTYSCYNSSSGLDAIQSFYPDIIVLKMEMPKIHGDMMLREINNLPLFSSIPILILTSVSDFSQKKVTNPFRIINEPILHKEIVKNLRKLNLLQQKRPLIENIIITERKDRNFLSHENKLQLYENVTIEKTKLIILRRNIDRLIFDGMGLDSNNYKIIKWIISNKKLVINRLFIIEQDFPEQINTLIHTIQNCTIIKEMDLDKLIF